MKNVKKCGLIVFAFILAIGLTACGSNQSASQSGNGNTSTSNNNTKTSGTDKTKSDQGKASNTSNSSTADTTTQKRIMNLNGRTITITAWWNAAPSGSNAQSKEMIAQQKKVEQEYNVKIKYVNTSINDINKKLISSTLSGKPFADIVRLQEDWAISDAAKKLLQPLNSYALDLSKYTHLVPKAKFSGTQYGFDTKYGVGGGVYYNRNIFKQYNLPDPHKLFKDGKWTWSEFEKLAKQATRDTNGDGQNDVWGLSGSSDDYMLFLVSSNDAHLVTDTGKVNLTGPKVKQVFDFLKEIHSNKTFEMEAKTPDNWKQRETFKQGNVAMTDGWLWQHSDYKNIDYGFVPFPKGPSGSQTVSPIVGPNVWFIPKGVKNPKAVIQIFNALQDVKPLTDYIGQNTFEASLKYQDDIDSAKLITQHPYAPEYQNFDGFPTSKIASEILAKHQDVNSVLKKYTPEAQTVVDKVLHPKK